MDPVLVVTLDAAEARELGRAGGKAVNLAAMAAAGLPVPPAFVVLTDAYRAFVDAHQLWGALEAAAARAGEGDARAARGAAWGAAAAAREAIARAEVPEAIARAITEAYAQAGGGPVAVRSSATAEDRADASFAGQQDTLLGVEGPRAVVDAVRACWASLWTARAALYRARRGIAARDVAIAVVVQRLVDAECAGVAFTADPLSGRRDRVVVEAAWGLGESVVGSAVTPDRWVLDARDLRVLDASVARKAVMTVRAGGGTRETAVPASLRDAPALDAAALRDVAALARRAAEVFGAPQDVEWARAGGAVYALQSRPITTLYPAPSPAPPPAAGLRVYVNASVMQQTHAPFTPMGVAVWREGSRALAYCLAGERVPRGQGAGAFTSAGARVFVDVTDVLRHPWASAAIMRQLRDDHDSQTAAILDALVAREPRLAPRPLGVPRALPPARLLARFVAEAAFAVAAPDRARARALASADAHLARLRAGCRAARGPSARRRFVEAALAETVAFELTRMMPLALLGSTVFRAAADAALRAWGGDAARLPLALRALADNSTMEMDLDLWRLARALRDEGAEPAADHPRVRAFLAAHGHRADSEIDIGAARWREDPAHVLSVLRTYIAGGTATDPEAQWRAAADEARRAGEELVASVRPKGGALAATIVRASLRRARALGGLRESMKSFVMRAFDLMRGVLEGAGDELVAAGRIDRASDVFFLELAELDEDRGDLRARVAARRAELAREQARGAAPRVLTSEGEALYDARVSIPGALVGTGASPGVYEGRVRVVRDPAEGELEPGDVLVAPGAGPAWTPLFLTAGALVTEIGGVNSHGTILARESGIPAVVGVAQVTERLRTGQRVRVDGASGYVVLLD